MICHFARLLVSVAAIAFFEAGLLVSPGLAQEAAQSTRPNAEKHRLLFHRVWLSDAELIISKPDGSGEQKLLAESGFDYNPSFSRNGRWIVFTSERNGSSDIYRVRPDGSGLERLTDDPAFDDQAALSPDGKRLVFVSSRGSGHTNLWVLNLESGKARKVTDAPGGDFRPRWSPDGNWIAFSSDRNTEVQHVGEGAALGEWVQLHNASIYIVRANGDDLRRLTAKGKFAGSPNWSPDGERIVFYEMKVEDTVASRWVPAYSSARSQIVSVDVETGARTKHTSGPGLKVSPQYVDEGRIGYLQKSAGDSTRFMFTTGEPGPPGMKRNPAWSPDGTRVVYHKPSLPSYARRLQNNSLFSPAPEFQFEWSKPFPDFSRDGRLVVSDFGRNPGSAGISVVDDHGNFEPVFHEEESRALSPSWSPDGEWIAVGVTREGQRARLILVRPDGSEVQELIKCPPNSGFPSWSPDGNRIVYRVGGDGQQGLRVLDLPTRTVDTLTTGYDHFPTWSPNGDRIAFTRFSEGDFDIFTIRPDGSGLTQLTTSPGNDAHPSWSPEGDYLLFSSSRLSFRDEAPLYDQNPQPYGELFMMRADGSNQRQVTDNRWEDGTPAWDPRQPDR